MSQRARRSIFARLPQLSRYKALSRQKIAAAAAYLASDDARCEAARC
jgi:hypothetical protein